MRRVPRHRESCCSRVHRPAAVTSCERREGGSTACLVDETSGQIHEGNWLINWRSGSLLLHQHPLIHVYGDRYIEIYARSIPPSERGPRMLNFRLRSLCSHGKNSSLMEWVYSIENMVKQCAENACKVLQLCLTNFSCSSWKTLLGCYTGDFVFWYPHSSNWYEHFLWYNQR